MKFGPSGKILFRSGNYRIVVGPLLASVLILSVLPASHFGMAFAANEDIKWLGSLQLQDMQTGQSITSPTAGKPFRIQHTLVYEDTQGLTVDTDIRVSLFDANLKRLFYQAGGMGLRSHIPEPLPLEFSLSTPGTYTFVLEADIKGKVAEIDETNNIIRESFVVQGQSGSVTPRIEFGATSYSVGDQMQLTLISPESNKDSATVDSVEVELVSVTSVGEYIEARGVRLSETGPNTGIFEGTVLLASGPTGQIDLQVISSGLVMARFIPSSDIWVIDSVEISGSTSSGTTTSGGSSSNPGDLKWAGSFVMRDDQTGQSIRAAMVAKPFEAENTLLLQGTSGQSATIGLRATLLDSNQKRVLDITRQVTLSAGISEQLPLELAVGRAGTYTLIMTADYKNQYGETDETNNIIRQNFVVNDRPGVSIPKIEFGATVYQPGQEMMLTVTSDASNKDSNAAETVEVDLLSANDLGEYVDSSRVTFVETAANTGVFTGQVLLAAGTSGGGASTVLGVSTSGLVMARLVVSPDVAVIDSVKVGTSSSTSPTQPNPGTGSSLSVSTDKKTYSPGESVIVSVSLSQQPNQNIAVSVADPSSSTVISRTLTTDSNGNAATSFTLPSSSPSGTYAARASAIVSGRPDLAGTSFEVRTQSGGLTIVSVQATDQQGNPVSTFSRGGQVHVKVVVASSSTTNALLTVNLFDSGSTTLGVGSVRTSLGAGNSEAVIQFFISQNAQVGTASIYANAYSDWPSTGGFPLAPERLAEVEIT